MWLENSYGDKHINWGRYGDDTQDTMEVLEPDHGNNKDQNNSIDVTLAPTEGNQTRYNLRDRYKLKSPRRLE
jgi:hypothetical protein